MSMTKKLVNYEDAMETICTECEAKRNKHYVSQIYCEDDCMVRQIWRDILDEAKATESEE
jgi:hypothetical protein